MSQDQASTTSPTAPAPMSSTALALLYEEVLILRRLVEVRTALSTVRPSRRK